MLRHRARQRRDDLVVTEHARLLGDLPLEGVHHPVVGAGHLLVHPLVLADVDVDREPEVGQLLEHGIEPRVVHVHAARATQPAALVAQFANASHAELRPAFEFGDHPRGEPGLVGAAEIEAGPHLEPVRIPPEQRQRIVQPLAGAPDHDHGLLDAHRVHRLHPRGHGLGSLDVGVRMDVDHRILRLGDERLRDLVDGDRPIVLEQQLIGRDRGDRRLRRGEASADDEAGEGEGDTAEHGRHYVCAGMLSQHGVEGGAPGEPWT